MIEIYPQLHVGSQQDYEHRVRIQPGWKVVHACKEPYHRQALGYSGRAAPKAHPEYLIARREHRLILNLVDAPDPAYIPKEIIDCALDFIYQSLTTKANVLIHCNEGASRAPSIGLLYLASHTDCFEKHDLDTALVEFRKLYPPFNPAAGMFGFLQAHFETYCRSNKA